MPTSEQDVEELHKQNDDLRSQIEQARTMRSQVQSQAVLDASAAALKKEQANLQAQLDAELAAVSAESAAATEGSRSWGTLRRPVASPS
jgi:Mg-chelatase subunit ChlI